MPCSGVLIGTANSKVRFAPLHRRHLFPAGSFSLFLCLKCPKEIANPEILRNSGKEHSLGNLLPVMGGHGEAVFLRVVRLELLVHGMSLLGQKQLQQAGDCQRDRED